MILRSGQYTRKSSGRAEPKAFSVLAERQTTLGRLPRLHSRAQPYWRRLRMRRTPKKRKIGKPKARLGLPDLDQSKASVISSLRSPESQRGYTHAIDEFIEWYLDEWFTAAQITTGCRLFADCLNELRNSFNLTIMPMVIIWASYRSPFAPTARFI